MDVQQHPFQTATVATSDVATCDVATLPDAAALQRRVAELEREVARLQRCEAPRTLEEPLRALGREESARREAEAALQAEREFWTLLIDHLDAAVIACDANGKLTLLNRAMRQWHGLPMQNVPMESWPSYYKLFLLDGVTPMPPGEMPLARALKGEAVRDWEFVIHPQSAPSRTLCVNSAPIRAPGGAILGAVSVVLDVSARRQSEAALRTANARIGEQERFLRQVIDTLPHALFCKEIGDDGRFTLWNRRGEELSGLSPSHTIGKNTDDVFPPEEASRMKAFERALVEGAGQADSDEAVTSQKLGAMTLQTTRVVLRDAAGEPRHLVGIAQDVTARQHSEIALRDSEERFRLLAEATFEAITITQGGRIIEANALMGEMFGYAPDALLGMAPAQFAAPESVETVRHAVAQNSEAPYEAICLRADGTMFSAEVRGRPITYAGQPARVTAVRDITERKQIEAELRESQRFAQSIADHSTSFIYVFDLRTLTNAYANRDVAELLGYDTQQSAAMGAAFLPTIVHPDDMAAVQGRLDGMNEIADGQVMEFEMRVRHVSGQWRWLLHREVVFKRDENGVPIQTMGNAHDISARKAAEERLQALLRELERSNEELQAFASVASHDLQEPLRKIQAFGNRLESKFGADLPPQGRQYLEQMQDAAARMSTLIRDLLLFSRVTSGAQTPRAVDLGEIARAVVNDLGARIEETGARVEIGALPTLDADASQMRQMLQNLIGNALKFHRAGAPPLVRVCSRVKGERVEIEVSDEGIGFDEKYLDRIFTVFQRLHGRSAYEGTGIGLAIVKKIVDRHGGSIHARSAPGEGATFVITLPLRHSNAPGVATNDSRREAMPTEAP